MAITELLLETLSESARVAYPYVRSLVTAGFSGNQIQEMLSGTELAVRRQDLQELVRGIRDIQDTGAHLGNIRNDFRPDPSRLPPPITKTLRNFSFLVEVRGVNTETGEADTRTITYSTNDLVDVGTMKEWAISLANDESLRTAGTAVLQDFEAESAVVVEGTSQI